MRYVGAIAARNAGAQLPDRVLLPVLNFIDSAMLCSSTFLLLKQQPPEAIIQLLFPLLYLTQRDLEEFSNDPQEYVRRNNLSSEEDFYSFRIAALNVIHTMIIKRTKLYLKPWMMHIAGHLSSSSNDLNSLLAKEASLNVIRNLSSILKTSKIYGPQVPQLLTMNVLPLLDSPVLWLRSRVR